MKYLRFCEDILAEAYIFAETFYLKSLTVTYLHPTVSVWPQESLTFRFDVCPFPFKKVRNSGSPTGTVRITVWAGLYTCSQGDYMSRNKYKSTFYNTCLKKRYLRQLCTYPLTGIYIHTNTTYEKVSYIIYLLTYNPTKTCL